MRILVMALHDVCPYILECRYIKRFIVAGAFCFLCPRDEPVSYIPVCSSTSRRLTLLLDLV